MPASKNMPLELLLKKYAAERVAEFPDRETNYYERYSIIKDHLDNNYYRGAGAGLALGDGARFTHHDIKHVDDVILAAGHLVGLTADTLAQAGNNQPYAQLRPYEVYLLLMAALLHDAGNAAGRLHHEKRIGEIVRAFGDVGQVGSIEQRLITSIARAHGGRTQDGDKDTITRTVRETPHMGNIVVHARRLAAIVRLADELSENERRADSQALKEPYDAPQSVLHNLYCRLINTHINAETHSVNIAFAIDKELLAKELPLQEGDHCRSMLIVDYIAERLDKTELERRYCNRFLANFASCDRITATLEVLDGDDVLERISVELEDSGYPSLSKSVKALDPNFDGITLRDKHAALTEAK